MTDNPTYTSTPHALSPDSTFLITLTVAISFLCLIVCFTVCCISIFCFAIRKFQKSKGERQDQNKFGGEEADPFMASNSYSDDDDDEPLSLNRLPSAPAVPFAEPNNEQNKQISFFGRFSN